LGDVTKEEVEEVTKWSKKRDEKCVELPNCLTLPYKSQPFYDFPQHDLFCLCRHNHEKIT